MNLVGPSAGARAPSTVTPRWEWRAFGRNFGPAEDAFAHLTPERSQDSDEVYLISPAGENVKVRDDLLEVKVLREVNDDGLQRWQPVMKASFPISTDQAARVIDAFGHPAPEFAADAYSLATFLSELIEPQGMAHVLRVRKHRVRYTVGGCAAELTDLEAAGVRLQTVAIESEDAAAVIEAVHGAGLAGWANTSYPKALERIVERTPERFAVIDVGTNSVKFHIGERAADGTWTPVVDTAEITRLGEGLEDSGKIAPDAIRRTVAAVGAMADEGRRLGAAAIVVVGTAGLRKAHNAGEAITAMRDRVGCPIEVIRGDEESRLEYLAVASGIPVGEGLVGIFDTGGGSTEFTFGSAGQVDRHFSLDIGSVAYTEQYGLTDAVSRDTLDAVMARIADDLLPLDNCPRPAALVGMGGAITNITAVQHKLQNYDPDMVQGSIVDLPEVDRQIERYASLHAEDRRSITGLQPKRADVILAGACIVRAVMDKLDQRTLTVSDRGLRHGLLLDRFG
jgi:exopolyphosphatase / guanosine-5'-triphosphate,3'-diphosphate pyrophosphatase